MIAALVLVSGAASTGAAFGHLGGPAAPASHSPGPPVRLGSLPGHPAPTETRSPGATLSVSIGVASATVEAGLTTSFTSVVAGNVSIYVWNFGDQTTSALADPAHTYGYVGNFTQNYTVVLHVFGANGSAASASIVMTAMNPVRVAGSPLPVDARQGVPTQLTSFVYGGLAPYAFVWAFGDLNTSTEQNPTHTFAHSGSYLTSITVTDRLGGVATYTEYVVVPYPPPTGGNGPSSSSSTTLDFAALGIVALMGVAAGVLWMRRRPPNPGP